MRRAACGVLLAGCAASQAGVPAAELSPEGPPVLMIVSGVTLDRDRMAAYSRALAESRLYEEAGGYYLNAPRPVAVFEGEVPDDFVSLIVRFPSRAAAERFWRSETYQREIKPLREAPSAGDYTVTVYEEAPVPSYMAGRVTPPAYRDAGPGR